MGRARPRRPLTEPTTEEIVLHGRWLSRHRAGTTPVILITGSATPRTPGPRSSPSCPPDATPWRPNCPVTATQTDRRTYLCCATVVVRRVSRSLLPDRLPQPCSSFSTSRSAVPPPPAPPRRAGGWRRFPGHRRGPGGDRTHGLRPRRSPPSAAQSVQCARILDDPEARLVDHPQPPVRVGWPHRATSHGGRILRLSERALLRPVDPVHLGQVTR